jgi:competence protein ComEA
MTRFLLLILSLFALTLGARAAEGPEPKAPPTKRAVKLPAKIKTPFDGGQVRLNTATRDELLRLPGIGPKAAEAILLYRKDARGFVDIAELQSVRGIGRKKFLRLAAFVTL